MHFRLTHRFVKVVLVPESGLPVFFVR